MKTAHFFLGASLFALLVVDSCCYPVKGYNPSDYNGSGQPNPVPESRYAPAAKSNKAPSKSVQAPSYQHAPQQEMGYAQPSAQRQHAAPVGFSSSVPAFQSGPQEIQWAVPPPDFYSGGEGAGLVSSGPEDVSPTGPMYQAGELSHFAEVFEDGDSQQETEELGYMPPPPPPPMEESTEHSITSLPVQESRIGGNWGIYPYYDYMFLTGQYPPGTVSHFSSSYENGRDNWQDVHYVRDYAPYNQAPAQQDQTFTGDFQDQWAPVYPGDEQDSSQAYQPAQYEKPTLGQAGGSYQEQAGY